MDYLKLVEELNDDMYDKHGDTEEQFFLIATGYMEEIGFGDITLWHSENDERKWVEKKGDKEPLKPFIKRELKKYAKRLSTLAS